MQTLPFWNSIEKCGLPSLVHKTNYGFYSEEVLLTCFDGHYYLGRLTQSGQTDDPKLKWSTEYLLTNIQTFTHWAYIPAAPKEEKE